MPGLTLCSASPLNAYDAHRMPVPSLEPLDETDKTAPLGPVERDGTQRIVLGPNVDEFLRASFIVRSLTMHVGTGAQRDDLLHLVGGRQVPAHVILIQQIQRPVLGPGQVIA